MSAYLQECDSFRNELGVLLGEFEIEAKRVEDSIEMLKIYLTNFKFDQNLLLKFILNGVILTYAKLDLVTSVINEPEVNLTHFSSGYFIRKCCLFNLFGQRK